MADDKFNAEACEARMEALGTSIVEVRKYTGDVDKRAAEEAAKVEARADSHARDIKDDLKTSHKILYGMIGALALVVLAVFWHVYDMHGEVKETHQEVKDIAGALTKAGVILSKIDAKTPASAPGSAKWTLYSNEALAAQPSAVPKPAAHP